MLTPGPKDGRDGAGQSDTVRVRAGVCRVNPRLSERWLQPSGRPPQAVRPYRNQQLGKSFNCTTVSPSTLRVDFSNWRQIFQNTPKQQKHAEPLAGQADEAAPSDAFCCSSAAAEPCCPNLVLALPQLLLDSLGEQGWGHGSGHL